MKKVFYIALLLIVATSCNKDQNIYSDLLKAERKLIEAYILREGITVVEEEPTEWGENVYWKLPDYDNFYIHMVEKGDTAEAEIESGETVLLRFKRYTLTEYPDTLYCWSTMDSPDPITFAYLVQSDKACTGWQAALKYMKYTDAQCKIICPSKQGFTEDQTSVIPRGFDMKIKIKRF